jgi:hypothetical protein
MALEGGHTARQSSYHCRSSSDPPRLVSASLARDLSAESSRRGSAWQSTAASSTSRRLPLAIGRVRDPISVPMREDCGVVDDGAVAFLRWGPAEWPGLAAPSDEDCSSSTVAHTTSTVQSLEGTALSSSQYPPPSHRLGARQRQPGCPTARGHRVGCRTLPSPGS